MSNNEGTNVEKYISLKQLNKQREKEEKERKEKELLNSIKPCPFCGEEPVVEGFWSTSIECKSPMCVMGRVTTDWEDSLENAVKVWNKRSG